MEAISSCLNGEGVCLTVEHLKSCVEEAIKNVLPWFVAIFTHVYQLSLFNMCIARLQTVVHIRPRPYEKGCYRIEVK